MIPADKWFKITKANTMNRREDYNVVEGLEYFPDDYIKWMFPLGISEHLQEEVNKWYSDYLELMAFRKNPVYGRKKCYGCLLSTHREEAAIFIGINKVVAKGLEEEEEEWQQQEENDDDDDKSQNAYYPCKVQNRFECPYKNQFSPIC